MYSYQSNSGGHRPPPPHHHNGGHGTHAAPQYSGGRLPHRPVPGKGSVGTVLMSNGHAVTGHGVTGHQHTIEADFALDLARIGEDKETRTTIMVCSSTGHCLG